MNQKLDHLREVLVAKQKATVSSSTCGRKRKRKRTKDPSDDELNTCPDKEEKGVPNGILVDNPLKRKSLTKLLQQKHVRFDRNCKYPD